MSVAVSSGLFRRSANGGFCVRRVGRRRSRQYTRAMVSVCRGRGISWGMKSPLWMMMGILCCLVSGVAVILTVLLLTMLSVMRREEDD